MVAIRGRMTILQGVQEEIAQCSLVPVQANDVKPDAWLIEFGLDSVNSVELVMALEERFDLELPDGDAAAVETVSDIVTLIEQQLQETNAASV